MGTSSPVTRPCLAMRSRYFGTGSWEVQYLLEWAAVRAHSREDRDDPKWSPSPLDEPAPRGVTHVSLCLSRGYDESAENPSGFLIFPLRPSLLDFAERPPSVPEETPRMDSY